MQGNSIASLLAKKEGKEGKKETGISENIFTYTLSMVL
jgi:hypothetical protein